MKDPSKIIRRMGYLRDQEGIMNRYLGESEQWQYHLEKTRSFIAGSFAGCQAESVAVLGSGWLLDVPLEKLRHRFSHIYLVDIHHPPQIRKKVSTLKEVELVEEDLSGGAIEQVWSFLRKHKGDHSATGLLEEIILNPPLVGQQADALISVNLLNQLDILLCDHIRRKLPFQQELSVPFRCHSGFSSGMAHEKARMPCHRLQRIQDPSKGPAFFQAFALHPLTFRHTAGQLGMGF